jgi:hypothetical protein
MNVWVREKAVCTRAARAAPLYVWLAVLVAWTCALPTVLALAMLLMQGEDNNEMALGYKLGVALKIPLLVSVCAFAFLDLQTLKESERGGEAEGWLQSRCERSSEASAEKERVKRFSRGLWRSLPRFAADSCAIVPPHAGNCTLPFTPT